jgi:hypothetical protein
MGLGRSLIREVIAMIRAVAPDAACSLGAGGAPSGALPGATSMGQVQLPLGPCPRSGAMAAHGHGPHACFREEPRQRWSQLLPPCS